MNSCPLCQANNETTLWRDERCRVILVADPDYPGFCRVVSNEHVAEMTDLEEEGQAHLMSVVFAVERTLRMLLKPDKINLASLGNQIPHLHWHVIPRFADDAQFPDAVWAAKRRAGNPRPVDNAALSALLGRYLASAIH